MDLMVRLRPMGKRGESIDADRFERRVRMLLAAGYSTARIAKDTGASYLHTSRIVHRITNELKGSPENERNR